MTTVPPHTSHHIPKPKQSSFQSLGLTIVAVFISLVLLARFTYDGEPALSVAWMCITAFNGMLLIREVVRYSSK